MSVPTFCHAGQAHAVVPLLPSPLPLPCSPPVPAQCEELQHDEEDESEPMKRHQKGPPCAYTYPLLTRASTSSSYDSGRTSSCALPWHPRAPEESSPSAPSVSTEPNSLDDFHGGLTHAHKLFDEIAANSRTETDERLSLIDVLVTTTTMGQFTLEALTSVARSFRTCAGRQRGQDVAAARRPSTAVASMSLSQRTKEVARSRFCMPGSSYRRKSTSTDGATAKDKLKSNGSNFTDWFRNVRIILEAAKKAYVFDAALGAEPALQKRFEHHSAYAMIGELNTLFQTQARAERYDASERFFNCKMEENSSVSEHVLRMSGYADRLRQLGIEIPNELGIDRVLQSLPPSYKSFVVNYNMQGMDRTLPQLLAMLKTAEVEIKKEHQVLMVNKTTSFKKAKGKKGNFKKGGKTVATPAKKSKSGPKPDTECFYCKGTGHWKRNCPKYLADKKAGNVKGEYLSYEFGTHLRQCGIVSQLTPPGTPQRNGVSERRNRTLLDMVRSMMSLTDLPLSFWGYALETAAFTLNSAPSKSVETTPYELWFGKKPKLSFLKVWGCEAYVKRLQPDKLEPKSEKCVFIGYPKETIGYTFYHRSEGKVFVAKNGSFLEKEFLSKEVSGRKVELDEVIEPSLEFECSAAPETVPVHPASAREEANDNDHEVLNETTTELRRSTRTRNTPEWYNVRVMNVMLLDNDEPANYEEAMMSPDSEKWLEAMKSEMGSMYENQVWTLVDLPNDRKAVENKWIFKKKTDADGNVTVYKARLVIKGFGFVQTHGEACIYKKVSGSSVAFLILYVDDILLIGNDIELLKSVKGYLNKSFSMKDLGEAAYILGIKIYRDDSKSQSGYVFILNG
ncbi:uncharacterized protein LOC106866720, partial [Brachypodium distachyon]|uniref:uncharacterized protein LOC106866720 n=1 Tax=Brachypodium distachyon TaxID=15368 RepID=UPI00071D3F47